MQAPAAAAVGERRCCLLHAVYCAQSTSASRAVEKAATSEPSCRRSLVPNARRCSTSARASTSVMRTLAGMPTPNAHLHDHLMGSEAVLAGVEQSLQLLGNKGFSSRATLQEVRCSWIAPMRAGML